MTNSNAELPIYVLIKRDLFESPKRIGYTGIRDKAGTWDGDCIKSYEIRESYDPTYMDHYALLLSSAPEFTEACFHDLKDAHLKANRPHEASEDSALAIAPQALDRSKAARAAEAANHAYGQWMPERWLHLFLDAYEGKK